MSGKVHRPVNCMAVRPAVSADGVEPVLGGPEEQHLGVPHLAELAEGRRRARVVEAELVVLGEVVETGRPQHRAAHEAGAAVVAEEEALDVALRQLLRRGDELVDGLGRRDAGLVEHRLAVDEQLHVDDLRDGIRLAVVGHPLEDARVEVGLRVAEQVGEVDDLAALDHVDRRAVAVLEDVGAGVGEQRGGRGLVVVAGLPADLDGGVLVARGVLLDGLLRAGLAVLVVPLVERGPAAAAARAARGRRLASGVAAARGERTRDRSGTAEREERAPA